MVKEKKVKEKIEKKIKELEDENKIKKITSKEKRKNLLGYDSF